MPSFLVLDMTTGRPVVECLGLPCLNVVMAGRPPQFIAAECHSGMSLYSWDWDRFFVGIELLKVRRAFEGLTTP